MFVYCRILCIQESLSRENSGGFILTMSGFGDDDPSSGLAVRTYQVNQLG